MTNETRQDPDELVVAQRLRAQEVGPDSDQAAPATAAAPAPELAREPDWLDRLWEGMVADERAEERGGKAPESARNAPSRSPKGAPRPVGEWWTKPTKSPCVHADRLPVHARPTGELVAYLCPACGEQLPVDGDHETWTPERWLEPQDNYYPRPPVLAAAQRLVSARSRQGLYTGSAAAAGWALGLEGLMSDALHDCGATASVPGALVLGVGGCLVIAHMWDRRTRHWWVGLAWIARIPLATALLALGLYAPGTY